MELLGGAACVASCFLIGWFAGAEQAVVDLLAFSTLHVACFACTSKIREIQEAKIRNIVNSKQ